MSCFLRLNVREPTSINVWEKKMHDDNIRIWRLQRDVNSKTLKNSKAREACWQHTAALVSKQKYSETKFRFLKLQWYIYEKINHSFKIRNLNSNQILMMSADSHHISSSLLKRDFCKHSLCRQKKKIIWIYTRKFVTLILESFSDYHLCFFST